MAPDDWEVGIWVIQLRGPMMGGGMNFFTGAETPEREDRSYAAPCLVVSVDHPFVVLEKGSWRSTVDTRRYDFKRLRADFAEQANSRAPEVQP